jgi:hypothetical protein
MPKDAKDKPHQVFAPKGCKRCRESGYYGRFPIAEILTPTDTIRDLILKGLADREILNVARRAGMKTIFEDGIDRVLQGLTTIEEVTRVVAPPRPMSEVGKKKPPLVAIKGTKAAKNDKSVKDDKAIKDDNAVKVDNAGG